MINPLYMKELLKEMLVEYQEKYNIAHNQCIDLMRNKLDFEDKAKEASGLKMMIEATIIEMQKYI